MWVQAHMRSCRFAVAERIALLIDEGLNDVGGSVGWATVESMAHFLANSFGAAPEFAVRL